ncbi:MAG: MBL fold metallo-hydrolase [Muribaculaceae bacterium]
MKIARFTVNPFSENTYLIWDCDTKDAAIIDPGMYNSNDEEKIDNFIFKNELHLKYMLFTHLHIDHVLGCKHIIEKYKLQVSGDTKENTLGYNLVKQAQMFGLSVNISSIDIEKSLSENDTIYLGNEKIEILSVPGHSPGSLVYYIPTSHFIICGDVLFQQSIGRTDLPGGNYDTLISGIKTKLLTLPADTVVYPGHGDSTTIGDEKSYNQYLR